MLNFIKRLIAFRLGQTAARGTARMFGFGRLAMIAGVIGGWRAWRRYQHRHV
ncbi:MAG TPA: hypothetical protein VF432_19570 [Thermoanaerobaculia bacterium]